MTESKVVVPDVCDGYSISASTPSMSNVGQVSSFNQHLSVCV
ncbi:unnamed protein product [Arabidopsis lyrata]|nr:unnamed protein product [Arabidopsis lyrata]CAH8264677.1 unnamed protein product [Arabidopsis lyrata]